MRLGDGLGGGLGGVAVTLVGLSVSACFGWLTPMALRASFLHSRLGLSGGSELLLGAASVATAASGAAGLNFTRGRGVPEGCLAVAVGSWSCEPTWSLLFAASLKRSLLLAACHVHTSLAQPPSDLFSTHPPHPSPFETSAFSAPPSDRPPA